MDQGFLDITATRSSMAFQMEATKPRCVIDGGETMYLKWNTAVRIPVSAGVHTVEVWVHYITNANMGRNSVQVQVPAGQGASVAWKLPRTVFSKGKITAGPGLQPVFVPLASVPQERGGASEFAQFPPGWHPDPARRYPLRWWNGTGWTDDVSDGGANVGKDPQGAA